MLDLPNFPFSGLCEKLAIKSYSKNTSKGREIDLAFIQDHLELQGKGKKKMRKPNEIERHHHPEQSIGLLDRIQKTISKISPVRRFLMVFLLMHFVLVSFSQMFAFNSLALFLVSFTSLSVLSKIILKVNFKEWELNLGSNFYFISIALFVVYVFTTFANKTVSISAGLCASSIWVLTLWEKGDGSMREESEIKDSLTLLKSTTSDFPRATSGETDFELLDEISSDSESEEYDEEESYDVNDLNIKTESIRETRVTEDLSRIDLKQLKVSVPVWQKRKANGKESIIYLVSLVYNGEDFSFKHGIKKKLEDFIILDKKLSKSKIENIPSLRINRLPKRKRTEIKISMRMDQRCHIVDQYLKKLLSFSTDPKVGDLIVDFLTHSNFVCRSLDTLKGRLSSDFQGSFVKAKNSVQWKDVWVIVEPTLISFCKDKNKKNEAELIDLNVVKQVKYLDPAHRHAPFPGNFHFLIIETLGSFHYLCHENGEIVKGFKDRIREYICSEKESVRSVIKSLDIGSGNKRVLNMTKLYFSNSKKDPAAFSRQLLTSVLDLYQNYTTNKRMITEDISHRYNEFCLQVCELQKIDLSNQSENAKVAFYINIYHTLIVHYSFEDERQSKLRKFLQTAGYNIAGYTYNLADIEHCILRASMNRPLVLKNSFLGHFTVYRFSKKDPRYQKDIVKISNPLINFVLNCGTKSSIYNVYALTETDLEKELEHASKHFLNEQIKVDVKKKTIFFPRIMQWYIRDFGTTDRRELLHNIWKYLPSNIKASIIKICSNEKSTTLLPRFSSSISVSMERFTPTTDRAPSLSALKRLKIRFQNYDWSLRAVFFKPECEHEICTL